MTVSLNVAYGILRSLAGRAEPIQYGELSRRYEQATGDFVDPHLGWSMPLLQLLEWCSARNLPPLPALVVNDTQMPGAGFWGQANTPTTPSLEAWVSMCHEIQAANWPTTLD